MRTVRYVGPYRAVEIETAPERWRRVERGSTIDVADGIAEGLLVQDIWDDPEDPKAERAKREEAERAERAKRERAEQAAAEARYAELEDIDAVDRRRAAGGHVLGVPAGTVDEVLAWVAGDPGRAATALEVERAGKARKKLLGALEQLVADSPVGDVNDGAATGPTNEENIDG